jgi:hypothetical protein
MPPVAREGDPSSAGFTADPAPHPLRMTGIASRGPPSARLRTDDASPCASTGRPRMTSGWSVVSKVVLIRFSSGAGASSWPGSPLTSARIC